MVKPANGPAGGRSAHLMEVAAGGSIVEEGAAGAEMFIIDDGEVDIVRLRAGEERVLSTLGPGDFFGEMSVLESRPRSATARAKTACRLLPIDASTLDALLREHPEIAVRMMRKLSGRLRKYEEEEERAANVAREGLAHRLSGGSKPASATSGGVAQEPVAQPARFAARLDHASGWTFALPETGELVAGRPDPVTGAVPEIDLGQLEEARTISRRHARFIARDGKVFLREEVGTSNGTFVGSDRLAAGVDRELADGEPVRLGRLDLVFRTNAAG